MTVHVTLAYSAVARNRSPADLEAALLAVPLDTSTMALMGLTLDSDTGAASGNLVTRTIVYHAAASPPLIPNANLAETLTNYYTVTFAKALATAIYPAPVVVS